MKSDIEIARETDLRKIKEVATTLGIPREEVQNYGRYIAKVPIHLIDKKQMDQHNLILVTAITPTKAGIGKTTVSIGLALGLNKIGKKAVVALREPSLGPCFGMKGGAAGGGSSPVTPMEDINLHFTGDMHALTAANNTLAALIDNHIHQGNQLGIDQRRVIWKRVVDINDRALRHVVVGLGGPTSGVPREDGFDITVASELMAIICLAKDIADLKKRIGRIVIGYTFDRQPVTVDQLGVTGAIAVLLKDAIKPNLVQTLEGTPALMHGGPFANIAHGCNSVQATRLAMKLADIAITEAGFGADLGAEKFMDIKCRKAGISPDCIVLVATVRALKYNGGVPKTELNTPDMSALERGICNLDAHLDNMKKFGVPVVVAINAFPTDTAEEMEFIRKHCAERGVRVALSEVFAKGGEGGEELAREVLTVLDEGKADFHMLYEDELPLEEKIRKIAKEIYGADGVTFAPAAHKELANITDMGYGRLPVCIAKTQYSLSDDASLLGRPSQFVVSVRSARLAAGAGFVVVETGAVMTMPGLPKVPAAEKIDVDNAGTITGLF